MTEAMDYTPEQLEQAQKIVADDQAKKAAALAAKRAAYGKATQDLIAMPEWATVHDKINGMVAELESDGQLSIHVTALDAVMQRLQEAVATLPAAQA